MTILPRCCLVPVPVEMPGRRTNELTNDQTLCRPRAVGPEKPLWNSFAGSGGPAVNSKTPKGKPTTISDPIRAGRALRRTRRNKGSSQCIKPMAVVTRFSQNEPNFRWRMQWLAFSGFTRGHQVPQRQSNWSSSGRRVIVLSQVVLTNKSKRLGNCRRRVHRGERRWPGVRLRKSAKEKSRK
jgi:hypothetical protein